jgi:hypothetical protein
VLYSQTESPQCAGAPHWGIALAQGEVTVGLFSSIHIALIEVVSSDEHRGCIPVRICGFVFLSTHYHLLLEVEDALTLSQFMRYLNSNLAREVGRLVHWKEKIWGRRYQSIPVSSEEAAQIDRLRYVLSHGCKEGLVASPREWPGLHCVGALVHGETVEGYWFDRTQEYAARRRGEKFDRLAYATRETVILSPLPCWRHLSPEIQKCRVTDLVAWIEAEAAEQRTRTGSQPLGVSAVRGQHPHDRPRRTKKSPAPLFHAFRKRVHRDLYEAYAEFVAVYREGSRSVRAVPDWQLPTSAAVRRRIALVDCLRPQAYVRSCSSPRKRRTRCVPASNLSPIQDVETWEKYHSAQLR